MKIIGFSSGVVGTQSNVDRMVQAIMGHSGCEAEFVKLNDLTYNACKGCVWLCTGPQVCMLEDDLLPYYQKLKEADAVVLGAAVHKRTVNAAMLAFMSRLWGYRHVTIPIKSKPFVLTMSAGGRINRPKGCSVSTSIPLRSIFLIWSPITRGSCPAMNAAVTRSARSGEHTEPMVKDTAH